MEVWPDEMFKCVAMDTLDTGGKILFRKKHEFEEWKWNLLENEEIEDFETDIDNPSAFEGDFVAPYYEITLNKDYLCDEPHGKYKYQISHIAYETVGEFFKPELYPVYSDDYGYFFNDVDKLLEHIDNMTSPKIFKSPVLEVEDYIMEIMY